MGNLFQELKRRNVVRVGIAYLVIGWVLIEVSDTIAPMMSQPEWAPSLILYVLILGLPVALFFSWAYELTPQGVKKTAEVDADDSITPATGRKLDFVIIGALVLALGYFVWDKFGAETGDSDGLLSIDLIRPVAARAVRRVKIGAGNVIAQDKEVSR